jgi:autotransporter translocation and assembly factor TamB
MHIVKRLTHVLVIVLTLLVGAAAAAIIVSQTAWFKNWLRGFIVAQANRYLNGTLSIERLGGNLFFGVEMENIGVSMEGSQVVAVKDLGLKYNVFDLISKGLSVDEIRLGKPVIYLRRDGDVWQLSRLVKKQEKEADREGPAKPIAIDAIEITDGQVAVDAPVGTAGVELPKRFEHLDAKLAFRYEPVRYSIEITNISFRGTEPALALNALSGGISVHGDQLNIDKLALRTAETSLSVDGAVQNYLTKPNLNLQITSDNLSIPEVARLVPALAGVKLQPAFELETAGTFDQLKVDMNVRTRGAGDLIGTMVADLIEPGQSIKGDVAVRGVDLAKLLADPKQKSDITANAHVDVHGESFRKLDTMRGGVSIDASRLAYQRYAAGPIFASAQLQGRRVDLSAKAQAYGASATTRGRVTLPDFSDTKAKSQTIPFDLSGELRHADLRKMPRDAGVPPADTNVNADYHAAGSIVTGRNATQRVKIDARFHRSTVAGTAIADGSTAGVSIDGKRVGYSADATVNDLDLERIGHEFNVPALAAPRYRSTINAHVTAVGRGTTPKDMNLTASGSLIDTSILEGRIPRFDFDATVADDTAHVKANGSFSGFDPATASGNEKLRGKVGGTLNVDATVANVSGGVTPDTIEADAQLALDPSTIGGLDISRANLDGTYRHSTGDIRTLDIVGRDVNVTANGTIALNDTDQSYLEVHADSPSLESIGKLVDQPLAGIAKIDATITGNRRELYASGNLTTDGLSYKGNGALTTSSDFDATVPELSPEKASVDAATHATFVSVGGQDINELEVATTYQAKQVDVDLTARQPQRSVGVGGTVLLHPDHQEVHLKRLAIDSTGQSWQLAPQSDATINYGGDAVAVERLALVSGDQRIAADGRFGSTGDQLKITLTNVELASIDKILLRPPQFSGKLNATSTIGGTREKPEVDARFDITQGGFRKFRYDSFGGTVRYAGVGITLDTKLQQNPTTFLTAKGYVPVASMKAEEGDGQAAAPSQANSFDLHIESTPIDLGIVQGFTTALTNVTGTLQAKIDVTGTAADPRPNGDITITRAAFTVDPTGVTYTDLEGRIGLTGDGVHIDQIQVLDNRKSPLRITGDLAIHERQVGGVAINLKANDFKVIDNKMGNVRINSDLRLTGEIAAPRVEGDLGISTGAVNLDPLLAQVGSSPYATQQAEYLTPPNGEPDQPASSPFDALQVDVHLTVPDDLVIKSDDLRAPGSPISLGALLLYLGGDLYVSKAPWDQVRLVGSVNTVRGHYDFQSRRFNILRGGTVKFEGAGDLDPALDIRTQRIIQSVTANVNVRGTLKKPDIVLTSVPPLEQADILSLIVFNQPMNSVSEGQQASLIQRAQALAGSAATGQFAKSIGEALHLDEFEINLAPESGGVPQVALGQQVGQNVYVKVEQGIGNASQTNVILEYELTKWLRLRTNVLQGAATQTNLFQRQQGSGADLLFFFSY